MLLGSLKCTESGILHSVFTHSVLDFNQTWCCVLSQAFILPSWVIKTQVLGGVEGVKYYPAGISRFFVKSQYEDPFQHINHPKFGIFSRRFRCSPFVTKESLANDVPFQSEACFFFSPGKFDGKPAPCWMQMWQTPPLWEPLTNMLGWWESLGSMNICRFKSFDPQKKTADQFQQNEAFPGWWGWFQPHDFPFWLERGRPRLSGYPRIGALSVRNLKKARSFGFVNPDKDMIIWGYRCICIFCSYSYTWPLCAHDACEISSYVFILLGMLSRASIFTMHF